MLFPLPFQQSMTSQPRPTLWSPLPRQRIRGTANNIVITDLSQRFILMHVWLGRRLRPRLRALVAREAMQQDRGRLRTSSVSGEDYPREWDEVRVEAQKGG